MSLKKNIYKIIRRLVLSEGSFVLATYPSYHIARFTRGSAILPVNGYRMYVDLKNDVGISKDLFIFKKREHLSTDFLRSESVLTQGDTVLDIGANIGYYALLESQLVGPQGKVYAVEPVENNFSMLQKNIELNDAKNITTFHMAMGDENKEAEINVSSKGNISSFIYRDEVTFVKKEKVQVVTVDSFVAEHNITPRLIRMDVEGYETEIIKGMTQTLARKPKLLMEVHPHLIVPEKLEAMLSTLEKNGYSHAVVIKEKSHVWMNRKGDIKPFLISLNKKINGGDPYAIGVGKIERMSLADLKKTLPQRGSAFHALFS